MNEQFIIIYPWMVDELKLTGNRLVIFAIIYGFSRNGDWFQGSISFLCKRSGITEKGVRKVLKGLCEDKLLERKERPYKGIKYVDYRVSDHGTKYRGEQSTEGNKVPLGTVQSTEGVRYKVPTKVNIESNKKVNNARARNKFTNYPQRENVDYDMIEAALINRVSTPGIRQAGEDIGTS